MPNNVISAFRDTYFGMIYILLISLLDILATKYTKQTPPGHAYTKTAVPSLRSKNYFNAFLTCHKVAVLPFQLHH